MSKSLHHFLRLSVLLGLTLVMVIACHKLPAQKVLAPNGKLPTSECRVVKHDLGETCVPLNPKRVVVLGAELDGLVALGVKPFGTTAEMKPYLKPYLTQAEAEAIKYVGVKETGPSLEAVLSLKPDLILEVAWGNSLTYQHLSQVVPMVVVIPESDGQWKPAFLKFAEALGKEQEAKQVLTNYDARLAEFKARMGDRLNHVKISLVRIYPNGISFYLKTSFSGSILAEAGLKRPPAQDKAPRGQNQEQVNKELIHVLESDMMFVWTYGHTSDIARSAQVALKRLQSDPLWSTLEVVQRNQIYEVPSLYWFGNGPIAANLVVDDLFKYFLDQPA
ncbi:ABC transporter substrate-binding protein [Myxacorys almedinensis]|uniref:ABC transporter substrate-binding protein n=1 Tax=Myxacorys almedinensis A TaxID=2690445 RepID=A0A8J7YX23_9CYAN|nr:iron-siderophore ABC transporter substrate-binding protein [Myxacorys almedinensis]NDJ15744.1 ABC transporter substrate-binding protein [Myxacorys almedinensis A]